MQVQPALQGSSRKEVQNAAKQAFELVRAHVWIPTFGSAIVGRESRIAMLDKHAPNMRLSSATQIRLRIGTAICLNTCRRRLGSLRTYVTNRPSSYLHFRFYLFDLALRQLGTVSVRVMPGVA